MPVKNSLPRPSYARLRPYTERPLVDPFALRVTLHGESRSSGEYVLSWMQSARRLQQNLALDFAIARANEWRLPVVVYESLRPDYPFANDRLHTFVLQSVAGKYADAEARGIRYEFFLPRTPRDARGMVEQLAARSRLVVTDKYPTFIVQQQTERFLARTSAPVALIDGNGMLPMRAFAKEQYSAKFLRDRAHRIFEQHWTPILDLSARVQRWNGTLPFDSYDGSDPAQAAAACDIDHTVAPVDSPGTRAEGLQRLHHFLEEKLAEYPERRTRSAAGASELSPYLHFGLLSIHELANAVLLSDAPQEAKDAYLEEAIIRRELSFNFCFYRRDHDSLAALPAWAMGTLDEHRSDRRKPLYSAAELESAETHDGVWNLAQQALIRTGTMHNYLRMLWGKKVIEWSATPEEAHRFLIDQHAKYAIDGRDPNTHAGVLWCFGKHDRPWAPERPIFGTIRYMSSDSTRKKVDLAAYRRRVFGVSSY
jgi:deoxyribodipyrimidine photo-lyase